MKLRIFTDGASRGNPGPGAAAFVIKNAAGAIICQEGIFLGRCTNNYAEFCALNLALSKALSQGASEVEIFSDSQLMVHQFNGVYRIKNGDLIVLMGEIRAKAGRFKAVRVAHVPREANAEADKLANIALDKAAAGDAGGTAEPRGQQTLF